MIRSIAFALLALLLTVGQASAECAWVLWGITQYEGSNVAGTGWASGNAAYPTHSKCWAKIREYTGIAEPGSLVDWVDWMRALGRYNRRMMTKDIGSMKPNDVYIGARDSGAVVISGNAITEWRCLPETLDPRGPRGRAR